MEDISFEFLRRRNLLLDFTIIAGDRKFKAHSQLLAARSGYFRDFICDLDNELNRVNIHHVDCIESNEMEEILDFIYTGKIELSSVKAPQYLKAASFLRIPRLRGVCLSFMSNGIYNQAGTNNLDAINNSNCLSLLELAFRERLPDIENTALLQCCINFAEIVKSDHFKRIGSELLAKIVADDRVIVLDETDVLFAIFKWVGADVSNRERNLNELLGLVRFALVDPSSLEALSQKDFIRESVVFSELVARAKQLQAPIKPEHGLNIAPRGGPYLYFLVGDCESLQVSRYCRYEFLSKRTSIIGSVNYHRDFAIAAHQEALYLVGGDMYGNIPGIGSLVLKFDTKTGECQILSESRSYSRWNCSQAVAHGDYVYAIGGRSTPSNIVERYSIQEGIWTQVEPLPRSGRNLAALVHDGYIYVAGGWTGDRRKSTDVFRYHIETDTWMHHSNTLTAKTKTTLCVCRNKLYAIGSRSNPQTSAEVYDEATCQWYPIQSLTTAPKSRESGYPTVEYNGKIYAFSSTHLECYDPDTGCWAVEDFNFPFKYKDIKYLKIKSATDRHRGPLIYAYPINKLLVSR